MWQAMIPGIIPGELPFWIMKNIIPPLNSGAWRVWTPKDNKMPIATSSDTELSLCAKTYTDCGKWVCEFDVEPGKDYEFSVNVRTERIKYMIPCVRAIVAWLDSAGELLRCDYAIHSEKNDDRDYRFFKHVTAPKGAPYAKRQSGIQQPCIGRSSACQTQDRPRGDHIYQSLYR